MRTHWGNFTLRTCPTRQHSSMVTSARQSLETGKHTWSSPELSAHRLSDPFKTPKLCPLRLVARSALSPGFSRGTVVFFYSENYAATCNRRDPIRLRSITFFLIVFRVAFMTAGSSVQSEMWEAFPKRVYYANGEWQRVGVLWVFSVRCKAEFPLGNAYFHVEHACR